MIAGLAIADEPALAPFGTRAAALRVLGRPLAEVQRDALDVVATAPDRPYVAFADHVWFTPALIARFVAACPPSGGQLVVTGPLAAFVAPLQVADAWPVWLVPGGAADPARLAALPRVELDPGVVGAPVPSEHPVFDGIAGPAVPVGDALGLPIRHWTHLHKANLLALVAYADGERRRIEAAAPWTKAWELAKLLWRAKSLSKYRLEAAVSRIGRADVHPTAVVEACVLEDGVTVGAHAVVRHSWIGAGSKIAEQARVIGSVVGPRATVAHGSSLAVCVVLDRAWVSRGIGHQACVFGPGSFVAEGVTTYDMSFGGEITVRDGDARRSAGTRFLGSCVGARARVGPHVRLGYGEEVPEGAFLVADPDGLVRKLPAGIGGEPMFARGGELIPVRRS
jgi:hypothetical protein